MGIALAAIAFQSIGTGLVAFFLWQLGRAIHVRFLTSWSIAAATLSVAVGFLYLTLQLDPDDWTSRASCSVYMAGSALAVFLFWSGLREYATGVPFGARDLRRVLPFLLFGAAAPWLFAKITDAIPSNFVSLAVLLALVLPATRFPRHSPRTTVGMPIVRAGLVILIGLFLFHGRRLVLDADPNLDGNGLFRTTVVFDALAELLVVFGTVILACERVRDRLESNNRELLLAKAELEKVARTDGLTGLLNRRAFEDWPKLQAAEAPSGCVAAIDVNDLKQLNDTHLHAAGDAALKLVGRALMNRFRVTDPIFRIGGDEFAVVMPGGSAGELARRLEAIDGDLENLRLPGVPGPYTLRIAWGVAAYSSENGLENAIQLADREMYAQKARRKVRLPAVLESHGPG